MNLKTAIFNALRKKEERGHPFLFWAIDLHGTLIPSSYNDKNIMHLYPGAEKCLRLINLTPRHKIILYTCTYEDKTLEIVEWLRSLDIHIDYINENPECKNTDMSDFSKKFYFDVLIDDKAGFEPESDWDYLVGIVKDI